MTNTDRLNCKKCFDETFVKPNNLQIDWHVWKRAWEKAITERDEEIYNFIKSKIVVGGMGVNSVRIQIQNEGYQQALKDILEHINKK